MRIRTIKPEFWRSDDIAALCIDDRLLFVGLWSYVDDSGVGEDKVSSIACDLFAPDMERDPSEVFGRVRRGLQELSGRGLILRYEVAGKRYLAITSWKKHQRIDKPTKSRYPGPDQAERNSANPPGVLPESSGKTPSGLDSGSNHSASPKSAESDSAEVQSSWGPAAVAGDPSQGRKHADQAEHQTSGSPPGALPEPSTPGTGEQGNRGTGEETPSSTLRADKPTPPTPAVDDRPDVTRVCTHLADRIEANGCKRPTITKKWRDAARLMLDADGRTEAQVIGAIDWCTADEFWRANILSMPKLRQQYDRLDLAARRTRSANGQRPATTDQRVQAGADIVQLFRDREATQAKEIAAS